jgi:hypothetical protein
VPKSDGWFKKGQSGNPGGRPKNHGEVQSLARQFASHAIFSLVRQATSYSIPAKDRRAAARLLIRIGFGPTSPGYNIIAELGWENVKQKLAQQAQLDEIENGRSARRQLTVPVNQ